MKELLYVTNKVSGDGRGGREQLSRLNSRILQDLTGQGFDRIELSGAGGVAKLFGYVDGVSHASVAGVCERILQSGVRQVFLDGSNLGRLAEGIKKRVPGVEVITFFHNCEARFFLGALRRSRTLKAVGVLLSNYLAERSAVRFSDKRVCLSRRDSSLLRRIYGRGATHVSAMAIPDMAQETLALPQDSSEAPYALFVGGAFYANQAGIDWYCQNVAPHVPLRTFVVGKGMTAMKQRLERCGNVTVVGEVDELAPWYLGAHVVVAPIFDGSGMKTKVAEALMFGKRVIGTPEAFSGYEEIAARAGVTCLDAAQFKQALVSELERPFVMIDPKLRALYDDHYSSQAACARLQRVVGIKPGCHGS
jgi:glycosyltransferase involved in cell wall biosynthesis